MTNTITPLKFDDFVVDANATMKSCEAIVRDYLEVLKKQNMISSVNVQMQGNDIVVDYTLPAPIQPIDFKPGGMTHLDDIEHGMKNRLSHMYTPDPIQVCLDNTRALLEKHRLSPITQDLTVALMEGFAEIMLKAHDIDANVDIHAIEVTDKDRF